MDAATGEPRFKTGPTMPQVRVGLIIPSVNRMTELQFNHYMPREIGVHVARGRTAGHVLGTQEQLEAEVERAAATLADCEADLIVFHCTGTAMSDGPAGEARILQIIQKTTGLNPAATSDIVLEALRAVGLHSVILLSPYKNNDKIIPYLQATGINVVHDVALGFSTAPEYEQVTPEQWTQLAIDNDRPEADGIFLSCTNTRQIEAINAIEQALGKPVINSNQAVLWGCMNRLRGALDQPLQRPDLGQLMQIIQ